MRGERMPLTLEMLLEDVKYMEEKGMSSITLVGGTDLQGLDAQIRDVVSAVRQTSDSELTINVGPSISAETLRWLKSMRVERVNCPFETIDPMVFKDAKPGDSLARRVRFMEEVEREGMKLGTIVMMGLGSAQDVIRSILYLKRFGNMCAISISTFTPIVGTPWEQRAPASIFDTFKAMSIARLAFPDSQVGLAFGATISLIPHQLMAGGGNTFVGILIDRRKREDNTKLVSQYASDLGFKVRLRKP
jgi:biotin synthase-like enzyme